MRIFLCSKTTTTTLNFWSQFGQKYAVSIYGLCFFQLVSRKYLFGILFFPNTRKLQEVKTNQRKNQTKWSKSHFPPGPKDDISQLTLREHWIDTQEETIYNKAYHCHISTLAYCYGTHLQTRVGLVQICVWKVLIQSTALWTDMKGNLIFLLVYHHAKHMRVRLHYRHF